MAGSDRLTADRLREAFATAEEWLARNRDAVNAINVYPVPDGDTGTNMLLTLRAACETAQRSDGGLGPYLAGLARGALLGARGNSGVILSQMLRGFAEALATEHHVDAAACRRALSSASRVAYEAVSQPVEGTMLTVLREAAAAAEACDGSLTETLLAAEVEAMRSVDRTPQLLPRLREAGVVDAGGLGVAVLLAGLRMGVTGEPLPEPPPTLTGAVELAAVEHEGHGYCTEYVVQAGAIDRGALSRSLEAAGGDSILVVGDARTVHVHVHMADPGPALSAGAAVGSLSGVKVDNMQSQHEQWAAGHEEARADVPPLGLVAVAPGPGIAAAFRALGATPVVAPDGKPSAGQLLEAARRAGREHVLLLPNDKDVVMAANQAAAEASGFITVIPTKSIPAGLSAAVAYTADGDREEIAGQMRATLEVVRSVEVTRAARAARVDGVAVAAGDPIAFVDGTLIAGGVSLEDALLEGVAHAGGAQAELVTIYLGADAPEGAESSLRARLSEACPHASIEVVAGGQPYYPYLAGVE